MYHLNRRNRLLPIWLTVLMIALLFSGAATAAERFTVGCTLPLTGNFGKAGELVRDAYTLWMETVNAEGGIAGKYPVHIIFYDDQSNPQTSARLVEKLITGDRVDLLLGGYGSSQLMAASAAAERHRFPLISGAAASNMLYERGFSYYFGTLGKATEEVRGCVDVFAAVTPKPKTVGIIAANIPFCALAAEGYKKYAEQNGLEVVHDERFPVSLQDYNTLLEKVRAKNPDVLLVGSHLGIAMRVVQSMKEIRFSPKAVAFSYGPTVPAFVEGLKADAEYVFAASEWTPNLPYEGPVFGKASDFNETYQKRFNRRPDYVEAATAAGAVVLQKAVEELGLTPGISEEDRVRLMKKLHEIDMMTFYGQVHFGEDGANVAHPPVAVQIQDGRPVNVFPSDAAEAEPRYPMPPWDQR